MEVVAEIKYDRQHQIGASEGLNSRVFMAIDSQLGGQLVAKEIEKANFRDPAEYFQEAKAMFATSHQNVVPIRFACETTSHVVLAMPYYPNGSLARRIRANPISAMELVRISQGILHGISQIHSAGFVHFDIKPSNVLFDNANSPLVADFGQARKTLPTGAATSLPYLYDLAIPPEVYASGSGSVLSDIYQTGVMFYRAINGSSLYERQFDGLGDRTVADKVVKGKLPDRNVFLPHVPQRIRTIIRKAMKPNPTERYQSATEFATVLARVDPGLDWVTGMNTSGEIRWQAERTGMTALRIELVSDGSAWKTAAWTVNGTQTRAKDPAGVCRSGLSYPEAMRHLNAVFGQLA
jgi:serine/threonine protein kinase